MKPLRLTHFIIFLVIFIYLPAYAVEIQATTFFIQEQPSSIVRQWERFEVSLINTRSYSDPYRDVQLNVVFTKSGGDKVSFWGFYDGGQNWKIRFMPDITGYWHYSAAFSDDTPGTTGNFRVVNSDIPGMLMADKSNPIWFSSSEKNTLIRGFHIGDRFFASNWSESKRKEFLDWIQKQGYNFLTIASHYLNREEEGRGNIWETPKLWPLNAGEYQKMERILDDLERRHIYVYPFAGFFGKNSSFPAENEDQESYVRYTIARIGSYWNLVFNVAGPEPNLKKTWMLSEDVERLGRLIKDLDVFGHMLTVHNATGDDPYRDSDWSTFGTLQGPKTLNRKVLSDGLLKNHHPAKPLLAQETLWPGNVYHPKYTDDDLRKNAYIIQMSATVLVYGDFNGVSSTGFSGTMELSDRVQKRHEIADAVWDFFETLPYFKMQPRQDLVSNGYCLAWPGKQYLVYLENGGPVDVKTEQGEYSVTWINARNTKEQRPDGSTKSGFGLTAPDKEDWLLNLVKKQ